MGGKSRKTGGVSLALIQKIKNSNSIVSSKIEKSIEKDNSDLFSKESSEKNEE